MARRRSRKSSRSSGKKRRSHRTKGKRRSGKSSRRKLARYMAAQQAQAGQVPQAGAGGYINDAVPDSSTLLAYKLLKDSAGANSAVFDEMLQNELKYLFGGISILKNDAKIAGEMGGESMANASKLAALLKAKTKEIDWNDRIEKTASDILYHDYGKPGKMGLAPNRIVPSFLRIDPAGKAQLDYRVSGATDHGIHVNRDTVNVGPANALPRVGARNVLNIAAGGGAAGHIQPILAASGVIRGPYHPLFGYLR